MINPTQSQFKTISLCYWNTVPNFGDALSPYIISKITGCEVKKAAHKDTNKLVAIGSLIRSSTLFSKSHIWGSGALTRDPFREIPFYSIHKQIQDWYKRNFKRSTIYAVRGPLTKSICEKAGFHVPEVYGDPAILIPSFYQPKASTSEKQKIGIVLHHTHNNQLKNIDSDLFKIINVERRTPEEVENFIDELTSCKTIFSSSLHGIIIAQAYGIPAQWITVKDSPIHDDQSFKFKDYFLGAGQEVQTPINIKLEAEALKDLKLVTPVRIKEKQLNETAKKLLESFPPLDLITN